MKEIEEILKIFRRPRFEWLQIEVTGMCDAACAYCTLNCYKDIREGGLMDMNTFERLQPYFAKAELVFLQGWGEPLLHPRFWEMARRAKASCARVGFTTNGTRLDAEMLVQLLDIPIDVMGVSIAGATAATSDGWRRGCNFARLGSVLAEFKRMKRARGIQGTEIHIAYMLLASNWREVEMLPTLAEAWGASAIVVNNLSFVADPTLCEESLFARPDLQPQVLELLETVRAEATARGIAFHYYRPDSRDPYTQCPERVLTTCFVSWRGDVAPCVLTNLGFKAGFAPIHYFQGRSYPVESCVFGNVNETTLDEIWKSDAARNFRAAFERRLRNKELSHEGLPPWCRQCYKLYEL